MRSVTLPETNIAPKNGWLEYYMYYFPIGEAYFQGQTASFREGITGVKNPGVSSPEFGKK